MVSRKKEESAVHSGAITAPETDCAKEESHSTEEPGTDFYRELIHQPTCLTHGICNNCNRCER